MGVFPVDDKTKMSILHELHEAQKIIISSKEAIVKALEDGGSNEVKILLESRDKAIDKSFSSIEKQMDKLCDISGDQAKLFNNILLEMTTLRSSVSSLHKRFDDLG